MALPRRAPREVYKVFSESEFVDGAGTDDVFAPDTTGAGGGMRFRRIAGPAMLAGVLAAVVAMLIMHRPLAGSPRLMVPGASRDARAGQSRLPRVEPRGLSPVRGVRHLLLVRHRTVTAKLPLIAAGRASGSQGSTVDVLAASSHNGNPEFGFER
ncbi:MAG TPA: hypothetical protein VGO14_01575 [Solirubrobacteraceae bacterium]|jgi:hypothetical protein|nr:hypothetical protein [Solirubrobacteraceae bacterium]